MPLVLSLCSSFALSCFVRFDRVFRWLLFPARTSVGSGLLQDLARSKSELVLENALLRHQLAILHRQSKPPHFTSADRFWFLFLASRLNHWKNALVLLKPETLLRWHREGFRLCWKHKSKPKTIQPKIAAETLALIQQMAHENPLWAAERIRGELLKLGIKVAKRTIQRYLRRTKLSPEPNQNWSTFLHTYANDIWACDFLPVLDLAVRTIFSSSLSNFLRAASCIWESRGIQRLNGSPDNSVKLHPTAYIPNSSCAIMTRNSAPRLIAWQRVPASRC
jgi:hypothetical protein